LKAWGGHMDTRLADETSVVEVSGKLTEDDKV